MKKELKEKLSIDLFVVVSLLSFVILGSLYVYFKPASKNGISNVQNVSDTNSYYLNENYNNDDPYITKNPGLKNILAGPIISDNDPAQGDKFSPVTLVYFSDFECSFCQKQEQVLKKLVANYKYKVRLIWKDYPDFRKDSLSYRAAVAGRCAQEQGQFWPYHDFLFANSDDLGEEKFFEIASNIKLNTRDFKKCYESDGVKRLIDDNIEEANALGITGIPYLYVNQKQVMGEIAYEELEQMVLMELK